MPDLNVHNGSHFTSDVSRREMSSEETASRSQVQSNELDGLDFVFDADYQHHFIRKVSPIQSATFDKRITVSLRPQTLILSSATLQRESDRRINDQFGESIRYQLGDVIDTSNTTEWIIFLLAGLDDDQFESIFGFDGADQWSERRWQSYLDELDETNQHEMLDRLIEVYDGVDQRLIAGPEGNHDGAAWGNGLDQSLSLVQIEAKILKLTAQRDQLEGRIQRYKRILKSKTLNSNKRTRFERKLLRYEDQLSFVDKQLVVTMQEQSQGQQEHVYVKQRDFILGRIDRLQRKSQQKFISSTQKDRLEKRIEILSRRLEYIEDRLTATIRERDRVKADIHEHKEKHKFNPFGAITNVFMGITKNRALHDPHGYWAINAGGVAETFDKSDYLSSYIQFRFPELKSEFASLFSVVHFDQPQSKHGAKKLGGLSVEYQKYDLDQDGVGGFNSHQKEHVELNHGNGPSDSYSAFWKEVRPGEYISCVRVDEPGQEHSHRQFFVQAFYEGTVNGREVYHIILDGMDLSEKISDLAYFSSMSHIQRFVLQSFIDQKKEEHSNDVMFIHSSHYPLRSHLHKGWKKSGWGDYFTQDGVAPFVFSGHGHMRAQYNETERTFFGKPIFFGKRLIKTDEPFYSLMTPSTTDAPNEFMSVSLSFDEQTDDFVLKQNYHSVAEQPLSSLADEDVRESFANVRHLITPQRYQKLG